MAKIDVSTIEGFADMTAEQKVEALANYEFPDPDYTGYVISNLNINRKSNTKMIQTVDCFRACVLEKETQ